MPVYLAALCHDGMPDAGVSAGIVRRADRTSGAYGPARIVQINAVCGEHVHICVPQARYRADIAPVSVEAVRPELFSRAEHVGDNILAEVLAGVRVILIRDQIRPELLPVEYIYAHGSKVALGLLWLLFKLGDISVLADAHYAKSRGFLHADLLHGDRARSAMLKMLTEHVGIVHLVDMVAREDEHIIRLKALYKPNVLIDRVRRAGKP